MYCFEKAKMPRTLRDVTDGDVDGYAEYRRRIYLMDNDEDSKMPTLKKFVSRESKSGKKKKGGHLHEIDNQWIPGYNPALLMKYRCHINVEFCGSIKAINYLYHTFLLENQFSLRYKYIYKGTDQGYMKLQQYKEEKDEIYLHKVSTNFDLIFMSL